MLLRALPTLVVLLWCAAPASAGVWLSGDLHVHTTYSHDVWGGPADDNTPLEDFYTFGQTVEEDFLVARVRGMDFLAITDHNDIRSVADPGFGSHGVIGIPGYEASLKGHGQMLGATRTYDAGDASPAAVRAMFEALRADGGILQANHPVEPKWAYDYADVPADTMEAWNLPWFYEPPLPASNDHEAGLKVWQDLLDRGAQIGATGGSDSHWKATLAGQGPGQPTTWVYAAEPTMRGVLDGLKAGHTSISAQPPGLGGARVFLEGRLDGLWSAMPGDTIAPGTPLRVRVSGAPGATVKVLGDRGRELLNAAVTGPEFSAELTAPAGETYAFAEVVGEDRPAERRQLCQAVPVLELDGRTTLCRNRIGMLALTSAIYFAPPRLPELP